jgi:hypothetical protein
MRLTGHREPLNTWQCRSPLPRVLEIDKKNKNEEDQTNHRDTRILTWKTLQCEGKNHGHQAVTTFTIFVECLQERHDVFRWLTRGALHSREVRTDVAGHMIVPEPSLAERRGPKQWDMR